MLRSCLSLIFVVISSPAQVTLDASLTQPVLPAGNKQTTFLKVGLSGLSSETPQWRAPVNVALVIDKSSSMAGNSLEQAKKASCEIIKTLSPQDFLSVIAYDDAVELIVPATRVTNQDVIKDKIAKIEADGSTALFTGLSRAFAEVRKFRDPQRVNRIILLSDGNANIGPNAAGELRQLGAKLIKQGISVTTIGLGDAYNEDLMTELALASDGNHAYAQEANQLPHLFQMEFGNVLSIVAQELEIDIQFKAGVRPIRILGRAGDIVGQHANVFVNQLCAQQEKFVVLEIQVDESATDEIRHVADIGLHYRNLGTRESVNQASRVEVSFSNSPDLISRSENRSTCIDCTTLMVNDLNKRAIRLRDRGQHEDAQTLLAKGADLCSAKAAKWGCGMLKKKSLDLAERNEWIGKSVPHGQWNLYRKKMYSDWYITETMQSY